VNLSVLQCVAVCGGVLQCVAVCVAVCCCACKREKAREIGGGERENVYVYVCVYVCARE